MSFLDEIRRYRELDIDRMCAETTDAGVGEILSRQNISVIDFVSLLSDAASERLEQMAQRARETTRRQFGNIVHIFTPLYISNYCENVCAYCSFARQHHISRRHLSLDEIRSEAARIRELGIRHILVLTGESLSRAHPRYIASAVAVLREYFSSISIEVYPLSEQEYGDLVTAGVDGLTIYQETYNEPLYATLHRGGPKQDYAFRLEAPDRACRQGIRVVTVGALFGLHRWRDEAFFTALHATYLQRTYPSVEVAVSIPRLRPLAGSFDTAHEVSDRQFVQIMTALRILLPSAGITVSTRESEPFRNAVLPMGVTKMSAGVSTAVGGHSDEPSTTQFEIADTRSVDQMKADLLRLGYQPVMHDWNSRYLPQPAELVPN